MTVTYNVREYMAACLASLGEGAAGLRTEVFVVDNASADGSADLVAERFPQVRVLRNDKNVGYAGAMNRGLREARGRWLLLLDPDTVVLPGALAALVAAAERWPEVGVAAAVLDDPGTSEIQASFRPFLTWRAAFATHTVAKPLLRHARSRRWEPIRDRPTDVGFLIGACLLVRREVLDTVGDLDEGYFLFCEDMEYCRRVVRAGWKLLYTADARIHHHEGKSAEQETPASMRMVTLASMLRYLEGETTRHPRALRRLFKAAYLAEVALQAGESALKSIFYGIVGRAAAAKHRRRCARAVRFLGYVGRVVRL